MLAEAAQAYEAGESWAAAGGVYIRGGLKDRAAAAYEKGGELETAAKLYEELGHKAKAAELFGRAGLLLQERRGGGPGRRAREGDRPPAAGPARRRELPRRHRAAGPALHRDGPSGPRDRPAFKRRSAASRSPPRTWISTTGWPAPTRPPRDSPAAVGLYKKIQAESLRYRDVNERVGSTRGRGAGDAAPRRPRRRPPLPSGPPRFVPREEIGRGPLGVVYRGEDVTDGRNVAMRILPAAMIAGPDCSRRWWPTSRPRPRSRTPISSR